jgi:hypothetical protein
MKKEIDYKNQTAMAYELGYKGYPNDAFGYLNSLIKEFKELHRIGIISDKYCKYKINPGYFLNKKELDIEFVISNLKTITANEIFSIFSWQDTYSMNKFIKFIIEISTTIEIPNFNDNYTRTVSGEALTLAIKNGNKEVVEMLLKLGADPNSSDGWSESPMRLALDTGFKEIAKIIQRFCNHANKKITYII